MTKRTNADDSNIKRLPDNKTDDRDSKRLVIATRIREARKNAGLYQGQVAKLLGLHRPAISEIEAGNRKVTAEEVSRMAELFDVSKSWLLGEGAEKPSIEDTRIELAARELSKLKSDDIDRLLKLLSSMRHDS